MTKEKLLQIMEEPLFFNCAPNGCCNQTFAPDSLEVLIHLALDHLPMPPWNTAKIKNALAERLLMEERKA